MRLGGVIAIGLAFALPAMPQYTIRTIAGGGPSNVLAAAIGLNSPIGVAVSPSDGNVYVVSYSLSRVFKIDAQGKIFPVAGTVFGYYSGDNGPATDASLRYPAGIAFDQAGNLFIADSGNNRVRRVDALSGVITTYAGGGTGGDGSVASAAALNGPAGLALDGAGNLYIAEKVGNKVRRVAGDTKMISTIAGTGQYSYSGDGGHGTLATLRYPAGVAVDVQGNVYIADSENHRIRRVSIQNGVITTFAGTGTRGYSGDGGAATAASLNEPSGVGMDNQGNVWIADSGNSRVRRVSISDGSIATIAGGGTGGVNDGGPANGARLQYPRAIATDALNRLYIADESGHRLRKVAGLTATSIITTLAGNGTFTADGGGDGLLATEAWFAAPTRMARDAAGNIYIADATDHRVRRIAAGTGVVSTFAGTGDPGATGDNSAATGAKLNAPSGLAFDTAGNLYISDTGNHKIRKVAAGTGIITTYAGSTFGYAGDGGPATLAKLYSPRGVAVDPEGNLYIADASNHRVRKVAAGTGVITTFAGNGTANTTGDGGSASTAAVRDPHDIAFDATGNVYIASFTAGLVRFVQVSTGIISTYAGNSNVSFADNVLATQSRLNFVSGLAVDSAGNLFIADQGQERIRRVDAATRIITTIAGIGESGLTGDNGFASGARFRNVTGLLLTGGGELLVADSGNQRVRAISPPCTYLLSPAVATAGAGAGAGSLNVVATGTNCVWTAVSNDTWLTLTGGVTGNGSGTVSYNVAANPGLARTGTITVAGLTFTLNQAGGVACTYTITPVNTPADWQGKTGTFELSGTPCQWTATSSARWLQVFPIAGATQGTIYYTVFPNFTGLDRNATITIAGRTFSVTQSKNLGLQRTRFIQMLYYNFLNRLPAQSEVSFWETALVGGKPREDMVMDFLNSEEFNQAGRFVAGIYVGILNRDAEYGGWLFQRTALISAIVGPDGLVGNFVNSDEFKLQHPVLTNAEYVRLLYRQILLREASQAEVDFQTGAVIAGGRVVLARNFLNSAEFRIGTGPRLMAFLLYATLVFRDPAENERQAAIAQLNSGVLMKTMVTAIINGPEFAALLN